MFLASKSVGGTLFTSPRKRKKKKLGIKRRKGFVKACKSRLGQHDLSGTL